MGESKVVKGDPELALRCYRDRLKIKKKDNLELVYSSNSHKVNYANLDPWSDHLMYRLTHIEDLKIVYIGPNSHQTT